MMSVFVLMGSSSLAAPPILGWSTWCTQSRCGDDWCSSSEVLSVASTLRDTGVLAAGFDHVLLDDCWGVRNITSHRIEADRERFPEGMPAFVAKVHALGFKVGVYTDMGEHGCHNPFTGSWPYYAQDAQEFASWGIDYVKFDYCGPPSGHSPASLTRNMSHALESTGRDMHFHFHCNELTFQDSRCGIYGDSFRIAPDHVDAWYSTVKQSKRLQRRQPWWGSELDQGWPDPDFVYPGGQGCGSEAAAGKRCPGQTDEEYLSEWSVWAIGGGQLVFATDPRNLSAVQRRVLFNKDVLSVFSDTSGRAQAPGKSQVPSSLGLAHTDLPEKRYPGALDLRHVRAPPRVGFAHIRHISVASPAPPRPAAASKQCTVHLEQQLSHGTKCVLNHTYGCAASDVMWVTDGCRGTFVCNSIPHVDCEAEYSGTARTFCKCEPEAAQIWTRPLSDGGAAVVLFNAGELEANLTVQFHQVSGRQWDVDTRLSVRDLWAGSLLGDHTGEFSATVQPHASVFVRFGPGAHRPALSSRPQLDESMPAANADGQSPRFRLVLAGIGPTSGQANSSLLMRWVRSRPWSTAYLAASVGGEATVEQLRELRRLGWAPPQLDEVTSPRRRARRAAHKRTTPTNLTEARLAWHAAGWTDAEMRWQCFCEDDSAGSGFAHDLLVLERRAGFTRGSSRLTGAAVASVVSGYVKEALSVLAPWPRIRKQARVGFPSSVHSVAPFVDAVLVERSNDDVGSLLPALSYARGAAWQYNLSDGWGVDLSLWWGVIDGCVTDLPASLFRRMLHVSYMAGAGTLMMEECGWLRADGALQPVAVEVDAFATLVAVQVPPAVRGHADIRMALVVPRYHAWSERPSWDDTHAGRSRWAFANLDATPQTAAIDGLMAWAYPGVGTFGYLAFPFGAFANNSDPPPSQFARSSITAEYAPDARDAFAVASDLPHGKFRDRKEAASWFRPSGSSSSERRDPSPMRPMESTRWGGLIDVLVDDDNAPGGWVRVLRR